MLFFKKKIYFPQFIADVISYQMDFLDNNFDKLIFLADKSGILTDSQKYDLLDKAHELMIVDILRGCEQHFFKKVSNENMGECMSIMYGKYLMEYKKFSKDAALKKVEDVIKLLEHREKAETKGKEHDDYYRKIGCEDPFRIQNATDLVKLYLCDAFCDYCIGERTMLDGFEEKRLVVFKFAMSFVYADVVSHTLKQYSVTFK